MKKKKYTDEQLIAAVKESTSIRQVLLYLGLAPRGGSYRTIHNAINKLNLDTSHFTGQAWSKSKVLNKRISTDDYLSNKKPIASYKLKNRLLDCKALQPTCNNCHLSTWLDNPIPLELDHIDGNNSNNNLDNLRLLCPNCHALTPTYRGKNKGKVNYSAQGGT
jgi:hypothetical protein